MKPISVVISSLRPQQLEQTIDAIAMHSDLIEVVVVSPWAPRSRDFVKHVQVPVPPDGDPVEREKKGELSLSKKINLGLGCATGKYIVFHNDDLRFNSGWAPALLKHMEKNAVGLRPYLAAFNTSYNGELTQRYTVFGLLYANLGCISKEDLNKVGGYLYNERMRTEYVDPDLSLRVWAANGSVGICSEVVVIVDSYTKLNKKISDKLCTPYKQVWAVPDSVEFFDIWFRKYFWLFFKNYKVVSRSLTNADGVLGKDLQNSGPLRIFGVKMLRLAMCKILNKKEEMVVLKHRLARLVNRRWATLDYKLPYERKEVWRKNP